MLQAAITVLHTAPLGAVWVKWCAGNLATSLLRDYEPGLAQNKLPRQGKEFWEQNLEDQAPRSFPFQTGCLGEAKPELSEKLGCSSWKSQRPHTSHQAAALLAWCEEGAAGSSAQVQEELIPQLPTEAGRADWESCAAFPSWSLSLCLCACLTIQE